MSLDPTRCTWRKSHASSNSNACVEVAMPGTTIGIRDTKNRHTGHLELTPAAFAALRHSLTNN